MKKIKLNKNVHLIIAILKVVIALIIFKNIPDKFLIKYEFYMDKILRNKPIFIKFRKFLPKI